MLDVNSTKSYLWNIKWTICTIITCEKIECKNRETTAAILWKKKQSNDHFHHNSSKMMRSFHKTLSFSTGKCSICKNNSHQEYIRTSLFIRKWIHYHKHRTYRSFDLFQSVSTLNTKELFFVDLFIIYFQIYYCKEMSNLNT